ncbi:MAG: helix-turn-helix transcriptional regulator [Oscillospiraceae bacterium]|nr:helix-turn-helix transcriptional regulator [Oscillospiraceae bacterium]
MHNSQEVAATIKEAAKNIKIPIGQLLTECGLSKNALSSMQSGGYLPRTENLAKIADYLDCSVDYLLGRTDNPQAHIKATVVNNKLITLLAQLTEEQQVMLEAQIKGLLEQKKDPPPKGDG